MTVLQFPRPAAINSQVDEATPDINPEVDINHDLVDSLTTLLANAKLGRISAMAWALIDPEEGHTTGWHASTLEQNDALLAGITRLGREFEEATRADE